MVVAEGRRFKFGDLHAPGVLSSGSQKFGSLRSRKFLSFFSILGNNPENNVAEYVFRKSERRRQSLVIDVDIVFVIMF